MSTQLVERIAVPYYGTEESAPLHDADFLLHDIDDNGKPLGYRLTIAPERITPTNEFGIPLPLFMLECTKRARQH